MTMKKIHKSKLYRGDCLSILDKIKDKSITLVLTDPPYWHNKGHSLPTISEHTKLKTNLYLAEGDMMSKFSSFSPKKIKLFLNKLASKMKLMNCYFFCNDSQIATYGKWAEKNGFHFCVLAWRKPLSVINRNRFSQNIEFLCRIYDFGTALNKLEDTSLYDRVLTDAPVVGCEKLHPTQKPISICKKIIELSSKEGDIVLDPFMGSGSTGVACTHLNRKFIGIEMEKKYFKIACDRIEKSKGTF